MICELSLGAFLLQPCYNFILVNITLHIILFLHLLFSPATQTCCSEAEEDFVVLQYVVLDERLPLAICLWTYGTFPLQCF
jgi:hypothetical protein